MEIQAHEGSERPRNTAAADSLQDFEARLCTRTKVPAERLSEFLGWNEDKVRGEAKVVTRILKRFAEAVVQSMEDPGSMDGFLGGLDLTTISRDHDWRAIFSTIRGQVGGDRAGRQTHHANALVRHFQVDGTRQHVQTGLARAIGAPALGVPEAGARADRYQRALPARCEKGDRKGRADGAEPGVSRSASHGSRSGSRSCVKGCQRRRITNV